MKTKVSVIIPAYNESAAIGPCLTALLRQDGAVYGQDYEIIVVDDASTDDTVSKAAAFPVKVVRSPDNRGRVAARKAGALSAAHDTLVFVDARVVVSPDLLDVFWRAGYSPLIGVVRPSADGDEINPAERIFYLIRRRYYIPRMLYGAGAGFAYIDKDNFSRSPKGAGCFFVRKDVFLASVPEAFDKYTNDDTAIFRHIVFGMNTPIMRHFGVTLRHSHRTDPARFIEWLMYRGSSFYDFYLRRSMVLRAIFAAGSAILFLVFLYCIVHPRLFLYTAFFVLPVYAIAVVFLAERVRDTAVVFPRLWAYILLFYGGMVRRAIITRFR